MAPTLQVESPAPPAARQKSSSRANTARYVAGKIAASLASLAFVAVFNFFLFRVLPGDPAKILTRNHAVPPERIAELRRELGLDEPLLGQFRTYVWNLLHGDLGISFKFRLPVSTVIADRIWPTLLLVGFSTIL